jgi:hypothetical protein
VHFFSLLHIRNCKERARVGPVVFLFQAKHLDSHRLDAVRGRRAKGQDSTLSVPSKHKMTFRLQFCDASMTVFSIPSRRTKLPVESGGLSTADGERSYVFHGPCGKFFHEPMPVLAPGGDLRKKRLMAS